MWNEQIMRAGRDGIFFCHNAGFVLYSKRHTDHPQRVDPNRPLPYKEGVDGKEKRAMMCGFDLALILHYLTCMLVGGSRNTSSQAL